MSKKPNKQDIVIDTNMMTSIEEIRKEEIIATIVNSLLIGANELDIFKYFHGKEASNLTRNVTKTEISECTLIAKDRIKQLCEDNIDFELKKTVLQLDNLYMKSYSDHDYKTCADILTKKSKILGIGSVNDSTQNVSGGVEIIHKYIEVGDREDIGIDTSGIHEKPPIRLT